MTKEQLIEDLKVMIKADTEHLNEALKEGARTEAHRFVDAIIDNTRQLQNIDSTAR